MITINKR